MSDIPLLGGGRGSAGAASSYSAVAVDFDGTNDALSMSSGLGISAGKVGLLSIWHYMDTATWESSKRLFVFNEAGGQERIQFLTASSNRISFIGRNSSGTIILNGAPANNSYNPETWHHSLISFDLVNSLMEWYIDDVQQTFSVGPTLTDDDIEACTRGGVGGTGGASPTWNGGMADLYYEQTYLDLTTTANRRNFIDASGKPVDISSYGSPVVRLNNPVATWQENTGSGGDFTETGELTAFPSSPSD